MKYNIEVKRTIVEIAEVTVEVRNEKELSDIDIEGLEMNFDCLESESYELARAEVAK